MTGDRFRLDGQAADDIHGYTLAIDVAGWPAHFKEISPP